MLCHLESLKSWLNTSAPARREMKGWVQESPVWQLRWRFQQQYLDWQDSQNLRGSSLPPLQSSPTHDLGVWVLLGMRNKTWEFIWQLKNTGKLKFISLLERFSSQPSLFSQEIHLWTHSPNPGDTQGIPWWPQGQFWNIFCLSSGGRKLHVNRIPLYFHFPLAVHACGKRIIQTWQSAMPMEMCCTKFQLLARISTPGQAWNWKGWQANIAAKRSHWTDKF